MQSSLGKDSYAKKTGGGEVLACHCVGCVLSGLNGGLFSRILFDWWSAFVHCCSVFSKAHPIKEGLQRHGEGCDGRAMIDGMVQRRFDVLAEIDESGSCASDDKMMDVEKKANEGRVR